MARKRGERQNLGCRWERPLQSHQPDPGVTSDVRIRRLVRLIGRKSVELMTVDLGLESAGRPDQSTQSRQLVYRELLEALSRTTSRAACTELLVLWAQTCFMARTPHGYHEIEQTRMDLNAAGFTSISIDAVDDISRARSPRDAAVAFSARGPR
jgi:hypothetical protein